MPDNFETYAREYADAAGLKPTDMPSSHHPLLESNEEVLNLGDLIDARQGSNAVPGDTEILDSDENEKPDRDDTDYRTLADFEEEMEETDPDPNVGDDSRDYLGDSGIDRSPDITGTVLGVARGMSTHLPQDIGSDGFQILEPEDLEGSETLEDDEDLSLPPAGGDADGSGHVLPTRTPNVNAHDDALDATRRLK